MPGVDPLQYVGTGETLPGVDPLQYVGTGETLPGVDPLQYVGTGETLPCVDPLQYVASMSLTVHDSSAKLMESHMHQFIHGNTTSFWSYSFFLL